MVESEIKTHCHRRQCMLWWSGQKTFAAASDIQQPHSPTTKFDKMLPTSFPIPRRVNLCVTDTTATSRRKSGYPEGGYPRGYPGYQIWISHLELPDDQGRIARFYLDHLWPFQGFSWISGSEKRCKKKRTKTHLFCPIKGKCSLPWLG